LAILFPLVGCLLLASSTGFSISTFLFLVKLFGLCVQATRIAFNLVNLISQSFIFLLVGQNLTFNSLVIRQLVGGVASEVGQLSMHLSLVVVQRDVVVFLTFILPLQPFLLSAQSCEFFFQLLALDPNHLVFVGVGDLLVLLALIFPEFAELEAADLVFERLVIFLGFPALNDLLHKLLQLRVIVLLVGLLFSSLRCHIVFVR